MPHDRGRPRHNFYSFITILKKSCPKDKDRQCICKCYAEILKEGAKPMINRKERIKKHLVNCVHFWNKYGEEAKDILKECDDNDDEIPPAKNIRLDG